ncbi:porin family protein [Balneola sp. MJW-20]|uniref:porin family protein n=1 Tax=Gracilimonas aurantiaca TaxID=3234185 RepID=UPI00346594F6
MKKLLFLIPILFFTVFMTDAQAQFEIGASYEVRDESPKNGFGVRVEKGIFEKFPLVNLRMRAHFSYFSESNNISGGNVSYSTDLTSYDFGLALTGGVPIGLIEPYAGLGLGSESFDLEVKDLQGVGADIQAGDENNIYWNTFIGARVTIIPLLKPFVEYRYSNYKLSSPDLSDSQNGRIMFGVYLSF